MNVRSACAFGIGRSDSFPMPATSKTRAGEL